MSDFSADQQDQDFCKKIAHIFYNLSKYTQGKLWVFDPTKPYYISASSFVKESNFSDTDLRVSPTLCIRVGTNKYLIFESPWIKGRYLIAKTRWNSHTWNQKAGFSPLTITILQRLVTEIFVSIPATH